MADTILSGRWQVNYKAENRQQSVRRLTSVSPSTIDTVNDLYSALQDLFDDSAQLDDGTPMSAQTPTEYTIGIIDASDTDPWFIDNTSIQYLSGGAITTSSWTRVQGSNTGIVRITYTIGTDFISSDVGKTVTNATSGSTGTLLNFYTSSGTRYAVIRPTNSTATHNWSGAVGNIAVSGGSAASVTQATAATTGEKLWANIYTIGTLASGTQVYIAQSHSVIAAWWSTGHIDVLILVRDGTFIDSGILTIYAREYDKLYDHYVLTTTGGRNPIPLSTSTDINNDTDSGTIGALTGITFTFGATIQDIGDGDGNNPYDVSINCGGNTIKDFYEYTKYVTRRGSATSLNGYNGEQYIAPGELRIAYDGQTGNFTEGQVLTNTTTGATAVIRANHDSGTTGVLVVSDVRGTFADNNGLVDPITGAATVNGTPTDTLLSKTAPFGTFAGGKFFSAQGVWLVTGTMHANDSNNYALVDSNGDSHSPPLTVPVAVNVKDPDGVNVENVRVFIKAAAGGPFPVDAPIIITNSGTTATVSHTSDHDLATGDKVVISGANHLANNGTFTVTVTGTQTYTYTMSSAPGSNPTGTLRSTFVVLSGLTDANGNISMSRLFPSNQPITGWARKSSGTPFYKQSVIGGSVSSSTGYSASLILILDD